MHEIILYVYIKRNDSEYTKCRLILRRTRSKEVTRNVPYRKLRHGWSLNGPPARSDRCSKLLDLAWLIVEIVRDRSSAAGRPIRAAKHRERNRPHGDDHCRV